MRALEGTSKCPILPPNKPIVHFLEAISFSDLVTYVVFYLTRNYMKELPSESKQALSLRQS